MSYYLDTSFLVSILFDDAHTDGAFGWLERGPTELHFSDWGMTELFALVQRKVRAGQLDARVAALTLIEFDIFAVSRATRLPLSAGVGALAAILARDSGLKLSAADALHLALSADGDHRMVTFDLRLAEAARARGYAVEIP